MHGSPFMENIYCHIVTTSTRPGHGHCPRIASEILGVVHGSTTGTCFRSLVLLSYSKVRKRREKIPKIWFHSSELMYI